MKKNIFYSAVIICSSFFISCDGNSTETTVVKPTVDTAKTTTISIGSGGADVNSKNTQIKVDSNGIKIGTKSVKIDIKK